MLVKVGGQPKYQVVSGVVCDYGMDPREYMQEFDYDKAVKNIRDFTGRAAKVGISAAAAHTIMAHINKALAAAEGETVKYGSKTGLMDGFQPLIELAQELALPTGIIFCTWGLIEIMMGNLPSGKEKIKYAIIGFIGIFLIPYLFTAIGGALGGLNK